jgi:ketosteroid isomerase-like protein
MKKNLSAFTILSALFLIACDAKVETTATNSFNMDSVKANIAASNAAFGKAWATGDSTSFASRYSTDACINPPNMPRMCGTAAITAFFNGGYAMGVRNIQLTTDEVMGGAEAVAETGKYAMLDSAGNTLEKGKFIVLWKEENGVWKMHRDVWNSDDASPAK